MADKSQLVDDSVHVPVEDPPPYGAPYGAPTSAIGLAPTAPSTTGSNIDASDFSSDFLRQLRSEPGVQPSHQAHWVTTCPAPAAANIPQLSMGYVPAPEVVNVQPQSPTSVAVTPASQTVIVVSPERAPPSYLWLGCLVYWFCNICAGGFAMLFAMVSSSAASANRMQDARKYSRYALWTSIAGMSLGIITVVLIALTILHHK